MIKKLFTVSFPDELEDVAANFEIELNRIIMEKLNTIIQRKI